ncbi:MAG: hypothetical protein R3D71_01645 [Rickettsiales bacterium]
MEQETRSVDRVSLEQCLMGFPVGNTGGEHKTRPVDRVSPYFFCISSVKDSNLSHG